MNPDFILLEVYHQICRDEYLECPRVKGPSGLRRLRVYLARNAANELETSALQYRAYQRQSFGIWKKCKNLTM